MAKDLVEEDRLSSLHKKVDELTLTMFDSLHSFRQHRAEAADALDADVANLASTLVTKSKEIDALIDQMPGLDRTAECVCGRH